MKSDLQEYYQQEYQERLLNEIRELEDRIEKLETIILSKSNNTQRSKPTSTNVELLTMQLNAMKAYLTILKVRKSLENI